MVDLDGYVVYVIILIIRKGFFCNRCKAIKTPKTKEEINAERKENNLKKNIKGEKTNWLCLNCQNLNYYFRENCNRCQIKRQKEFPSINFIHNHKISRKNNNIILDKNIKANRDINTQNNHIN